MPLSPPNRSPVSRVTVAAVVIPALIAANYARWLVTRLPVYNRLHADGTWYVVELWDKALVLALVVGALWRINWLGVRWKCSASSRFSSPRDDRGSRVAGLDKATRAPLLRTLLVPNELPLSSQLRPGHRAEGGRASRGETRWRRPSAPRRYGDRLARSEAGAPS
jgi:hypothetical protein